MADTAERRLPEFTTATQAEKFKEQEKSVAGLHVLQVSKRLNFFVQKTAFLKKWRHNCSGQFFSVLVRGQAVYKIASKIPRISYQVPIVKVEDSTRVSWLSK